MPTKHIARRVGLARALSKLGYCSRTTAGEMIRDGRVRLNGRVRRDPETPVDLDRDRIVVDGAAVGAQAKVYLMLNKPRGVITTASDEKGRSTVFDYLGEEHRYVAPVGRLDKASEGLLLLTNDSEWSAKILAPETHFEKIYHVQVAAVAGEALLSRMEKGILSQKEVLRVKKASVLRGGDRNTWLEIVLEEGKNRQIRRILTHLGTEVLRLVRVAVGPLTLGNLPKGKVRALAPAEKQAIDRAMHHPLVKG